METVVYRQTAGKQAWETVAYRADWHRRAASSLSPRRRLAPSEHADRSAPWGSRTPPVTSAVEYERWLPRPNGSLRLRSSGVPRASSVFSDRACATVSGSVFQRSYERSPHPCYCDKECPGTVRSFHFDGGLFLTLRHHRRYPSPSPAKRVRVGARSLGGRQAASQPAAGIKRGVSAPSWCRHWWGRGLAERLRNRQF